MTGTEAPRGRTTPGSGARFSPARAGAPRRLRRGLFIAPFDELADARALAALAALAEERDWDGFFLWDHVQYPAPIESIADVWTCLAAVAMRTERMRLGPLVTPLARRRPWVLARQAVTLDRLSGGRLVLGFGVGGDGNGEMGPLGEEPEMRVRAEMLDEGLELLARIFSGEPVGHAGRHYRVDSRPFLPRAAQSPRIPIWLGARWPATRPVARACRWDGIVPVGLEAGEAGELAARTAALRSSGSGPFQLVAIAPPGADPTPWEEAGFDWLLTHLGPAALPGDGPEAMPPAAAVREAIEAGPPATRPQPGYEAL